MSSTTKKVHYIFEEFKYNYRLVFFFHRCGFQGRKWSIFNAEAIYFEQQTEVGSTISQIHRIHLLLFLSAIEVMQMIFLN